jgi:2'-5' RNA ligase
MSSLYFIALIPPEPIYSEVYALKQEMSDKYNSHRCLRNPPHITLLPPVNADEIWEKSIIVFLGDFVKSIKPFDLVLNGFESFPNRRRKNPVIYVHNEDSPEMNELHKKLISGLHQSNILMAARTQSSFSPHMTIGYRDLTLEEYDKAWEEFKEREYRGNFHVKSLFLLKFNRKESRWNIVEEFYFSQ